MGAEKTAFATIDEYLRQYAPGVRQLLQTMRETIREAAPKAAEKIGWQMPTFYLYGNLVHFAARKSHIGFYAGAGGIEAFKEELAGYKSSKGAVQFPYDRPLPLELVKRVVEYRANENTRLMERKKGLSALRVCFCRAISSPKPSIKSVRRGPCNGIISIISV